MKVSIPARGHVVTDDPTVFYDDDLLVTKTEAWTAVEIPLQPFAFKSHMDRFSLAEATALALAAIKDGDLRIKVVRRPFSPDQWQYDTAEQVARTGRPSVFWADYLDASAQRAAQVQGTTKMVVLLRRLGQRGTIEQVSAAFRKGPVEPVGKRELQHWREEAVRFRQTLARGSLRTKSIDATTLRWLRRHALARGLSAPADRVVPARRSWGPTEIADEFGDIELTPTGLGVKVERRGGVVYTSTLVMSAFPVETEFPGSPPWLAYLDRIGDWTEADLVLTLRPPKAAKGDVMKRLRLAQDQEREAGADLPIEVQQVQQMARESEFSIIDRRMPTIYGWGRIHVDASTEAELANRVEYVIGAYAEAGSPRIDLAQPTGMAQVDLLTESIPGFGQRQKSWQQRWVVETVAASLPQAGSNLSHPSGFYAGYTTGQYLQAVHLDLHRAITRRTAHDVEGPGGFVFLGNQRAGKSSGFGMLIDYATTVGNTTVCIDFSGPLARMADLPRHEGRIQVLDLLKTGGGVLDTMSSAVIPGDARTNVRVRQARMHLTRDTVTLIAWRYLKEHDDAVLALQDVIGEVATERDPRLATVIDRLLGMKSNPAAVGLAKHLLFELGTEDADALLGHGEAVQYEDDPITRIITAPGLALPRPGKPKDDWMPAEALGAALFSVAGYLGRRLLWELPSSMLKFLLVDEAHIALGTEAGRHVIESSLRDGPKHGVVVGLATHNTVDLGDERIVNALANKFAFRSTAEEELTNVLRICGIEDTTANRNEIRGLRNGECIAVLDDDTRDRFQWDLFRGDLKTTLNTTPSGVVIPV